MVCPILPPFLGGVSSTVVNEILKSLWKRCKPHPGYAIFYKKKFKKLKDQVEALQRVRNDVQRLVEEAKKNNEVIRDVVNKWLDDVSKLETEFKDIEDQFKKNKRWFMGRIPDLSWRYKTGKKATKKAVEAEDLKDKGEFRNVSQAPEPPTIDSMPVGDFMAFGSTRDAMDKVMRALENENVYLIGIYGMGGVGKTTLMEEIGRRLEKEKKFDAIIKVVVSQNPSIAQIQRDIADALGLRESGAGHLAIRLKKEKKVLIMLDDIWARLELKQIGIPYGEEHQGCKIILTSRKREVCHVMETNDSVEVTVLSGEDSWKLFKIKAGKVVDSPDIEPVARQVADECGGLPLAIVVVARALGAYEERSVWEDAKVQLKQSIPTNLEGVEEQLFKSLELSYKQLKAAELKQLFLYCCLFREDYDISEDEVTRYAVGENLLRDASTLEEMRGRVHFFLEKLKASCLLLNSKKMGCVKLHDVVRDVAVYIASKDDNHFLVKAGLGMRNWPEDDENLESYKRISVMNNDIHAIPENPNCSNLVLLLLNMNPITDGVPSKFFENMVALNVLDLSYTSITSLPSSLECLKNLRTLHLNGCKKLSDIAVVGKLKAIRILSLKNCPIRALPEDIDTSLKLLDVSYCRSLVISENLISNLTQLEELYMEGYIVTESALREVASLKRLVRVELYVKDAKDFSQSDMLGNAFSDLHYFVVYNVLHWRALVCVYQKSFYLKGVTQPVNWAKTFLRTTEDLRIEDCQLELTDLTHLDKRSGFESLKHLSIANSHQIEYLLSSTQGTPTNAFVKLEKLHLWHLQKLKQICQGQLPAYSFQKLRLLDLQNCENVIEIFPRVLLERVNLSLEELIIVKSTPQQVLLNLEGLPEESILFPNLRLLRLYGLSNLTNLCNGVVPSGSLRNLNVIDIVSCNKLSCLFPQNFAGMNLKRLKISRCQSLAYVFLPSTAKELKSLDTLEIKSNSSMEAIVAKEDGVLLEKGGFPMLKHLQLVNLPELSCFYKQVSETITFDWPSLDYVLFERCPNLSEFPIGIHSAPGLKKVHVGQGEAEWFKGLERGDTISSSFEVIENDSEVN